MLCYCLLLWKKVKERKIYLFGSIVGVSVGRTPLNIRGGLDLFRVL
jgi:hypothetical protein